MERAIQGEQSGDAQMICQAAAHIGRLAETYDLRVLDDPARCLEEVACSGKMDLAKKAKALNLDAIHDTVHEMAKDEARHGRGFEGLLKRYFNTEV